jgi:hypothetical protein
LLQCMSQELALFPRSDRQETRVQLQCYFHRTQRLAETEQIDPELNSTGASYCDAAPMRAFTVEARMS